MPPRRSPKKTSTKSSTRAKGVIRGFKTKQDFADWLEKNHGNTEGILLRIAKKDSGLKSITYQEALEIALCYGWIDAIKLSENDKTWLQRFLPRRAKSIWSKINREKAIALIESGLMRPPGHAEIERAKNDGRWEAAYDSPAKAQAPPEFLAALDRNPKAKAFFETINRSNRYAITWRLATAKTPEKREHLLRTFVDMLEKGKTLH
jgi:uncharacterized protein YdeI (YjbR/CyaY-like superfamily)